MITAGQLGSNMDPTHHEKIVDKLMQYRGKIPKYGHLGGSIARAQSEHIRRQIDELIKQIDLFAEMDNRGLIR